MAPSTAFLQLVLTLGAAATAAASASARVVMDSVAAVPHGWGESRPASPDDAIFLRVALKQPRGDALDQAVLERSTPGHPSYGMHMTADELRSYTAPSQAAVSAVTQWLQSYGIQPAVDHDWVSFNTTVRTANDLLDTKFAWYQYLLASSRPQLRTLSYSVPDDIAAHIDLVQPTTRFGHLGARKSTIFGEHRLNPLDENAPVLKVTKPAQCSPNVTPDCLKSLYNIGYKPSASAPNKVAFASFLEQYARYADFELFQHRYVPDAVAQNFTVAQVHGGLNDQGSQKNSMEANLDAQYLLGISHPIPLMEYSTAGRGPLVPDANQPTPPGENEPYLDWLQYLAGLPDSDLPQTISVSYGEDEQSVPREYALKVCSMFRDLGARGVSVLFSSGDSGPGGACIRSTDNAIFFEPGFPASCPWVTAVGGTTGTNPEKAVSFSSGGFSIYHDRPAWQSDAVAPYLATHGSTYAKFINQGGRGTPDVSAQARSFAIYDKGSLGSVAGTSASAPVMAGIVALLSAARVAQGKPPLGFLNPLLYANPNAFTDITAGAGIGCSNRPEFGGAGAKWNATAGWDPVTGLGTPKFDKLLEVAAPGTRNA